MADSLPFAEPARDAAQAGGFRRMQSALSCGLPGHAIARHAQDVHAPVSASVGKKRRRAALVSALLALVCADAAAVKSGPARTGPVDMVVIHATGGPVCDPETRKPVWVGAGDLHENLRRIEAHPRLGIHYMIDRDGAVQRSVPEHQVAHHVYRHSRRSIAIELVNDGDGRDPFPEAQIDALVVLLQGVAARHRIERAGIKRHSDLDATRLSCAPERRRKVDPGDAFPYEQVLDRVFEAR